MLVGSFGSCVTIDEHGQRQSTEIAEIDVTQDYELILCGLASGCALMSDGASVAVVSGVESVMVPRGACASESAGLARSGIRSTWATTVHTSASSILLGSFLYKE